MFISYFLTPYNCSCGFIDCLVPFSPDRVNGQPCPCLPPDLRGCVLQPSPCGCPRGCSPKLTSWPHRLLCFFIICAGDYLFCQLIWKCRHTSGEVLFSHLRSVFILHPCPHAPSTVLVQVSNTSYWSWCNSVLISLALQSCPGTFQSSLYPSLHAFFPSYN